MGRWSCVKERGTPQDSVSAGSHASRSLLEREGDPCFVDGSASSAWPCCCHAWMTDVSRLRDATSKSAPSKTSFFKCATSANSTSSPDSRTRRSRSQRCLSRSLAFSWLSRASMACFLCSRRWTRASKVCAFARLIVISDVPRTAGASLIMRACSSRV